MKNRLLIIIFLTTLIISLIIVSHMEYIQREIWIITGEYDRNSSIPSLDYDFGLIYATVLEIFGITAIIIFGINYVNIRRRKLFI